MSKLKTMSKVIVITGTRKGIGRFLSEYYLSKGYIVAGCSRSESNLSHSNYSHYILDVSDETTVRKMITDVYKQHCRIDFLINNAGIASMNHSLFTPGSTIEKVLSTNVIGTFLFSREVAKIMVKQKSGRIINFTTIASPLDLAGEAIYASSKAAVEKFTKVFSKEIADYNITVNAIGPSPIKTDLIKNISEDKMNKLLEKQAIHQFGTFEDICNITDFFLKDESIRITGQIIYLCGVF